MANDTVEKPTTTEEGVWIAGPDGELVPDYDAAFPEALGVSPGEFEAGWRRTLVKSDAWWVVGSIHLYDLLIFMAAVITCGAFLRLLVRKKRYEDDEPEEDPDE